MLWASRLREMRIRSVREFTLVNYNSTPAKDQPIVFRACLAVASALQCTPEIIGLEFWHADGSLICEFRSLPPARVLYLLLLSSTQKTASVSQGWPVARLLQLVPKECTTCYVQSANMSQEQVEAIVYGAPVDRTAESALTILVAGQTPAWVTKVKGEMQQQGMYQHVSLEHWNTD